MSVKLPPTPIPLSALLHIHIFITLSQGWFFMVLFMFGFLFCFFIYILTLPPTATAIWRCGHSERQAGVVIKDEHGRFWAQHFQESASRCLRANWFAPQWGGWEREREKTVISSLLSRVAGGRSNGKYFISARVELGWGGMKCMCICVWSAWEWTSPIFEYSSLPPSSFSHQSWWISVSVW